jgi:hypothetical protein
LGGDPKIEGLAKNIPLNLAANYFADELVLDMCGAYTAGYLKGKSNEEIAKELGVELDYDAMQYRRFAAELENATTPEYVVE